ncbi:beta-L-arabinofuranosidase domain-containing protein [Streptomyces sp. NPDC060194]|uniref:beta-L-arabinofuranosidase domain-containing protein n=1 Tax=Streptomyces sp. NPDC060194 TaxID=3347069 RepID=UPI00364766FF
MTTSPAPTPAGKAAFAELPLGAVRPAGWLLDQLRIQAAGLSGKLDELWEDVGPNSAWLGGDGENWERGPYYLDGLLPLAHLTGDPVLLAKTDHWVEAILARQRADGFFGPEDNDDWWPRTVAVKVLTQHADATGDPRVEPFLTAWFRYQLTHLPKRPLHTWGRARGADAVLGVLWLHARTGESWLTELAELLLEQTDDWEDYLTERLITGRARTFDHLTHGPNVAMGLKSPAVRYLLDGVEARRAATVRALENLDRHHGLAHGLFSGDEWLAGRDPHHGVETCQVVEYMFTMEQIARIFGDGRYGDLLELAAFNHLPASCDARMTAHQYHQQANQVLVSVAPRDWSFSGDDANLFGLEPHFGCCTANYHQGWPKFVRSLWMATADSGLAAVAYAPAEVSATAGGADVTLRVVTEYPFGDTVTVTVDLAEPTTFPLLLRVPGWCTAASLTVAGRAADATPDASGYVRVERTWAAGDTVELTLPMAVRPVARDRGALALRFGPLVLAHAVEEIWSPIAGAPGLGDYEVRPRKSWNWALATSLGQGVDGWDVRRHPVGPVPFDGTRPPLVVTAPGIRVPEWTYQGASSGPLPDSPVPTGFPAEDIRLLPYGSARLRVTEFPQAATTRPQGDGG